MLKNSKKKKSEYFVRSSVTFSVIRTWVHTWWLLKDLASSQTTSMANVSFWHLFVSYEISAVVILNFAHMFWILSNAFPISIDNCIFVFLFSHIMVVKYIDVWMLIQLSFLGKAPLVHEEIFFICIARFNLLKYLKDFCVSIH